MFAGPMATTLLRLLLFSFVVCLAQVSALHPHLSTCRGPPSVTTITQLKTQVKERERASIRSRAFPALSNLTRPMYQYPTATLVESDPERERATLSLLYNETQGPSWLLQLNWGNTEISMCDWFGVVCSNTTTPSIVGLVLPFNNLKGHITHLNLPNLVCNALS
jgi:hypothetical protein